MKFSKRIKLLASLVDKNTNVVDIGCDHGLLDIYLTLYNNNKCIASDINENALSKAVENIEKMKLDIKTILSNGFDNVDVLKNSTAVIAGMGTNTIIEILQNKKRENIDTFIIQTNKEHYELRKYMISLGYYIVDEIGFIDKKIPYVIIKFKKGYKKYNDLDLKIGPLLLAKNDSDTLEYMKHLYLENKSIINKIPEPYIKRKKDLIDINKKIKKLYSF